MRSSNNNYIDISVLIKPDMHHWPGDPEFKITRTMDMDKGDIDNVSMLEMGSHTGTHMDAPLHFLKNGKSLDQLPLNAVVGPARVIEIRDDKTIKPEELEKHNIKKGERILFKTSNSSIAWKNKDFYKDFVYISLKASEYLVKKGISVVGIDYLSVGGFYAEGDKIHQTLLGAGIWVIEGLDLSNVGAGEYELICLPLKILGSDGAPARVVLRIQT